jgi:hypothetical protein
MEELSDCKVESYNDALLPNVYGTEVAESFKLLALKMHLQICRPNAINRSMVLATLYFENLQASNNQRSTGYSCSAVKVEGFNYGDVF